MTEEPKPELKDFGWGNGWGTWVPDEVKNCLEARARGEKHDVREFRGPGACVHEVRCLTCNYKYMYDSGD